MYGHDRRTGRTLTLAATLLLAVVIFGTFALSAWAVDNAKVTIKAETGGAPTRFTFVADVDKDAPPIRSRSSPRGLRSGRSSASHAGRLGGFPWFGSVEAGTTLVFARASRRQPAHRDVRRGDADPGGTYDLPPHTLLAGAASVEGSHSRKTPPREEILARARQPLWVQWNAFADRLFFTQLIAPSVRSCSGDDQPDPFASRWLSR
jgi:hypothetical protein